MSIVAVRRVQFCAGHRIHEHESKCRHLHGHNYEAHFHAECPTGLDALGRVIDFGVLKSRLGSWLEENWDHGLVLWEADLDAIDVAGRLPGQKIYLLPDNPTAENMARHLLTVVAPRALEGTGVTVAKVVLWETPNCYVEVTGVRA